MYIRLGHKVERKPSEANWELQKKIFTCRVRTCKNKPQRLFCNKGFSWENPSTIFALSKGFLRGAPKQFSSEGLCPTTGVFGQWVERFRHKQFQVHVPPLRGPCSASFRTSEPVVVLPRKNKPLHRKKKAQERRVTLSRRRMWVYGCRTAGVKYGKSWRSTSLHWSRARNSVV